MRLIENENNAKYELSFIVGEGVFTIKTDFGNPKIYNDTYGDGIEEANRLIASDPYLQDAGLSKYSDIKSLLSLKPVRVVKRGRKFFTVWKAVVDKNEYESDYENILSEIKDEISGQTSDGWGEGFEQEALLYQNFGSNEVNYHPYGTEFTNKEITVELMD